MLDTVLRLKIACMMSKIDTALLLATPGPLSLPPTPRQQLHFISCAATLEGWEAEGTFSLLRGHLSMLEVCICWLSIVMGLKEVSRVTTSSNKKFLS